MILWLLCYVKKCCSNKYIKQYYLLCPLSYYKIVPQPSPDGVSNGFAVSTADRYRCRFRATICARDLHTSLNAANPSANRMAIKPDGWRRPRFRLCFCTRASCCGKSSANHRSGTLWTLTVCAQAHLRLVFQTVHK